MGNQQYVPQNPYQQQQQHPQQQQQRQQQQQQQPEVPMTENMKDLQLISFEWIKRFMNPMDIIEIAWLNSLLLLM